MAEVTEGAARELALAKAAYGTKEERQQRAADAVDQYVSAVGHATDAARALVGE